MPPPRWELTCLHGVFKSRDLPLSVCLRIVAWAEHLRVLGVLQNSSNTPMETIGEIIPFAKEMLNQRPSRGMLKVYMLGSTMAVLGVVGGLVETYLLPFAEQEAAEEAPAELSAKKEKRLALKSHATPVRPEVVDVLTTVGIEAKAKHLVTDGQRMSRRLHAS